METAELPTTSRTCCRCGAPFPGFTGRENKCPACRKLKEPSARAPSALTPRQRSVVALVAECKPNKQIAFELGLTEGTVKEYLYTIFRTLKVGSRLELARLAWKGLAAKEQG